MQISTIKNQNFEKPSKNLSDRTKVKILKKKFCWYLSKKFGSAYAQSPRKCSNIEILAKIEGKEAKFFSKIYEGQIRIWFRSKKNSKLSHACVPLSSRLSILSRYIHFKTFCRILLHTVCSRLSILSRYIHFKTSGRILLLTLCSWLLILSRYSTSTPRHPVGSYYLLYAPGCQF